MWICNNVKFARYVQFGKNCQLCTGIGTTSQKYNKSWMWYT